MVWLSLAGSKEGPCPGEGNIDAKYIRLTNFTRQFGMDLNNPDIKYRVANCVNGIK